MRQDELLSSLKGCIQRELVSEVAVLFSGGLDCSLVTHLAAPHASLSLYTVGYEGSHDLKAGERVAKEMGLPWYPILIDDRKVRAGISSLRSTLLLHDPLTISFELPMYFVCSSVPQPMLLSGQGADELFGGYARYSSMDDDERGKAMRGDQDRLVAEGYPREALLAKSFGKTLSCPYLCPEVMTIARRYSSDEVIGAEGNKLPLRRLAAGLGLSSSISPKKAAQYGSGIMSAMKRMASKEGVQLSAWVQGIE
jgi:asparagine synthase (glutamine-hydrolysing)